MSMRKNVLAFGLGRYMYLKTVLFSYKYMCLFAYYDDY